MDTGRDEPERHRRKLWWLLLAPLWGPFVLLYAVGGLLVDVIAHVLGAVKAVVRAVLRMLFRRPESAG